MNPSFLLGAHWVEVFPDYLHDTDETLLYHGKDKIDVTFLSQCNQHQITQATGSPAAFSVDVLDT